MQIFAPYAGSINYTKSVGNFKRVISAFSKLRVGGPYENGTLCSRNPGQYSTVLGCSFPRWWKIVLQLVRRMMDDQTAQAAGVLVVPGLQ